MCCLKLQVGQRSRTAPALTYGDSMTLSTSSFILTGHDKVTGRATYVHVTMTPSDTQPQTGDSVLDIRYKVTAKFVNPLVYWFMVKVLKYEVR